MAIDIIEDLQNASLDRPLKGLLMENGLHIFATKQDILDEQAISKGRVANAVIYARDIKKWLVFDESGENYEEKENPGSTVETTYRDTAVLDHVESVGFDENKKATIENPQDQRFMLVDLPTRLYNSGDVDVTLDSSKPIGVIQLENFANYNWDYPELIIRLYVDSDSTYLGGFRIPYGFGAVVKYNLDNKSENNLSKGYWTWSMFVVDWSVVKKVASSEGQFSSVETAYLGLFGDEGEDDERVFYPAMFKQDVNGWTQFEFTGNMLFKSKGKDSGVVGDKVLELKANKVVAHKDFEMISNATYSGDTSQQGSLINRGALESDKAKGEWIGGVFKDTINDEGNPDDEFTCNNPKHWIEYRKTTFQGDYALIVTQGDTPISSEIVIHLHPSSGMNSTQFKVVTNDGKESTKTVRVNEKWRFFLRKGTWPYYERIDDGSSGYVLDDDLNYAIEENNDEIIAPVKGDQFQLVDSEKSSSYGNASKQVSYFQPAVGTQSDLLLSKLNYGKAFAIHEEVNTTKLIMILHESLVSQIYNKDLTGINELTMLFTGDSRGRLAKANQTAAAQFAINWNGELIPATNDANELNPTEWVAPDDSVTETWSTGVKSVCYSTGILANRGSAMLKRGDVIYSKPQSLQESEDLLLETPRHVTTALTDSGETAVISYDNNSEFFVMPIVAGGGTFNVMKVFQLFMGRKKQYIEDWGSIRFEQSSDCIGTILKISYDAAIAQEEANEQEYTDNLRAGLAAGAIYAKNVQVG